MKAEDLPGFIFNVFFKDTALKKRRFIDKPNLRPKHNSILQKMQLKINLLHLENCLHFVYAPIGACRFLLTQLHYCTSKAS